jgi:predicted phosphodiesterase
MTSEFDPVPDDKSVIVVSDLHLGLEGQQNVNKDFSDFLEYLGKLKPKGAPGEHLTVSIDGKMRELYAPDKFVLLGDIVDLWSPRNNSYSSALEDSFPLISSLLGFPAKIVYVAGNHDEEIAEIKGCFPKGSPTRVKINQDHYPDNPPDKKGNNQCTGIKIGDLRYFFLHGQQFDMMFNTAGILQDYPGWVSKNYMLFREHPVLKWGCRLLCGVSFVYILASIIWSLTLPFEEAAYFILGLTLIITLFTIEPTSFRALWDFLNRRIKAKTATIETIIEEGFWKPEAGNNLLADVVVFGHTHVADDSKDRYLSEYHKRFINSGAWGSLNTVSSDGYESEANSFIYIDAGGPLLFYWPSGGKSPAYISTTLTGNPKKKIKSTLSSADRFRRWRRRVFWIRS